MPLFLRNDSRLLVMHLTSSHNRRAFIEVIVYFPHSLQGQAELSRRVADVHAQIIYTYILRLDCPVDQKTAILDAIQSGIRDDIKNTKTG